MLSILLESILKIEYIILDANCEKKNLYLNGPNLNMLGKREPEIYGQASLEEIKTACLNDLKHKHQCDHQYEIDFFQSNSETALIEKIHTIYQDGIALIINPAAYGHTSLALYDAVKMLKGIAIIEIHLSSPMARESFRQKSWISLLADGIISGFV